MRIAALLLSVTLLSACQSTPDPVWNAYSSQERLERIRKNAEPNALLGDRKGQLALANAYLLDESQSERIKALPLLRKLAETGDNFAMYLLTSGQALGLFGQVSESEYEMYAEEIEKEHEGYVTTHVEEKKEWTAMMSQTFEPLQRIYNESVHLCEQPLLSMPETLSADEHYMVPKYLHFCLTKYSFSDKASERLMAKAKMTALHCSISENTKRCVSDGYEMLANGTFTAETSDDDTFIAAAALRSIFKQHEHELEPYNQSEAGYTSYKASKNILKALEKYNADDVKGAIRDYRILLKDKKLSTYDRAYTEMFLGKTLVALDDDDSKNKGIKILEQALSRNILSPSDSYGIKTLLANLYLSINNSRQYLVMIDRILSTKGPGKHVLPQKTSDAIQTHFAQPEAVVATQSGESEKPLSE